MKQLKKPQKQSNLLFWILVIVFIIMFLAVPGLKVLFDAVGFLFLF